MYDNITLYENPSKIAVVGTHLPCQCGIATFTSDILIGLTREASSVECWGVVINDIPEGYRYPPNVRFEIHKPAPADYKLAANFLNINKFEVVYLQHEFGIYGGDNGKHVLELMGSLRMPVITTLHTVLHAPNKEQLSLLKQIVYLSDKIVVMSDKAKELLVQHYNISEDKITLIHHGIPDVPFVDPNYYKDQFGVEGRKVILTFGLLSPGKGIESMIEALPEVIKNHPEVVYIVLGATHPQIRKERGEEYRFSLQRRAKELGVSDNLIFHNRFVELSELCEFLGAADIYVTPYLNRDQISSGTLAYAMGTGKAVISTPYFYAEEMLSDGRGRIVPFKNSKAIATEICDLLENESERHAMRKRAYTFGRQMIWKEVSRKYLEVFLEIKKKRETLPVRPSSLKAKYIISEELPKPQLDHIIRLTDDVGILQHAKYIVPDRYHGYCTDDNSRALIAVLMAQDVIDDEIILSLACRYLSFLHYAFNKETQRFRNFMSYDRRWIEEIGSEDSHGRAIWGLGEAVALSRFDNIKGAAMAVFEMALPSVVDFTSPRSWAFALVGIHAYLRKFSGDSEARRIREKLANKLYRLYKKQASDNWPWIEDGITYANGKISQALIMSGQWLQRGELVEAGLRSLEWLIGIQMNPKGHFTPIGNHGWYNKNGLKSKFDQQPIEALSIIEACREAYNVSNDLKWINYAKCCFEWFLGKNDLNAPLYDYKTGGCYDGLSPDGPNRNQGAESTLVCFLSLLNMYQIRNIQTSKMFDEDEQKAKR